MRPFITILLPPKKKFTITEKEEKGENEVNTAGPFHHKSVWEICTNAVTLSTFYSPPEFNA